MEPAVYNFKFTEDGRKGATSIPLSMERAIEIARDRCVNHCSEVKLSVETAPDKFLTLGTYAYSPATDNTGRLILAIPRLPKNYY